MKIKLLIMDADGTLTDGKIYMGENGEIMKAFNVKDGYGIHNILPKYNILPIIITGRQSKILKKRCAELEINELFQNVNNKLKCIQKIINDKKICCSNIAYIGDDINDIEVMKYIKNNGGLVGCPSDSTNEILNISDYITQKTGGNGAVREFIEWIISKNI